MSLRNSIFTSLRTASRTSQYQCLRFSTTRASRDILHGEPSSQSNIAEPLNRSHNPQSISPLSSSEPAPSNSPTSPQSSIPTFPSILQKLPYHVSRSTTRNLPVYTDRKAGGNLKQTRIRKIVGNTKALSADLAKELEIDPELVAIGSVTGHIVIKGHFKDQVEAFLKAKGF
jgi:large subunit ribosomal protein L49